jgi:hypothetical protein
MPPLMRMMRGNVVAESARRNRVRSNPLAQDVALFNVYMIALDEVIANPEIRAALDEFRISPNTLRMQMITQARRVFEGVPQEFASYEAIRGSSAQEARDAQPVSIGFVVRDPFHLRRLLVPSRIDDPPQTLRMLGGGTGIAGCLLAVAGMASIPAWPWAEPLLWAGVTLVALAGMLFIASWLVDNGVGLMLGEGGWIPDDNAELGPARNGLMAAVGGEELLAQARTFVNAARQDQFGHIPS